MFNTRYQVLCNDQDFSEENLRDLRGQVFDQENRESFAPKEEALSLLIEEMYLDW